MQLFPWFTASSSIKYGKVFIDFDCEIIDSEMMEKFDVTNQTLVDYFAVIGPDNDMLSNLIQELKSNDHVQGGEYNQSLDRQSTFISGIWQESKGKYRVLHPKVLARFPKQERADKLFPRSVNDYFFD